MKSARPSSPNERIKLSPHWKEKFEIYKMLGVTIDLIEETVYQYSAITLYELCNNLGKLTNARVSYSWLTRLFSNIKNEDSIEYQPSSAKEREYLQLELGHPFLRVRNSWQLCILANAETSQAYLNSASDAINVFDEENAGVIHHLALAGRYDIAEDLARKHPTLLTTTRHGLNPLHYAILGATDHHQLAKAFSLFWYLEECASPLTSLAQPGRTVSLSNTLISNNHFIDARKKGRGHYYACLVQQAIKANNDAGLAPIRKESTFDLLHDLAGVMLGLYYLHHVLNHNDNEMPTNRHKVLTRKQNIEACISCFEEANQQPLLVLLNKLFSANRLDTKLDPSIVENVLDSYIIHTTKKSITEIMTNICNGILRSTTTNLMTQMPPTEQNSDAVITDYHSLPRDLSPELSQATVTNINSDHSASKQSTPWSKLVT